MSDFPLPTYLPVVDLDAVDRPNPGILDDDVVFCCSKFDRSDACRLHYQSMRGLPDGEFKSCPYGFASAKFSVSGRRYAVTGFIPFPRFNTEEERKRSKEFPAKKIARERVLDSIRATRKAMERLDQIERSIAERQSMALHEVRKLNRTVKQTAERLANSDNPNCIENSAQELEAIWKAAELMSSQFDILELLANESLATLPLNTTSEPYKVFDKLKRIYHFSKTSVNIRLDCQPGYRPRVRVCDKTFPILASVLMENAIKYSTGNEPVVVRMDPLTGNPPVCRISIANIANDHLLLDERVFEKGFRVSTDGEGTGKGLFLAQLVARQHEGRIVFKKTPYNGRSNQVVVQFSFDLIEVK